MVSNADGVDDFVHWLRIARRFSNWNRKVFLKAVDFVGGNIDISVASAQIKPRYRTDYLAVLVTNGKAIAQHRDVGRVCQQRHSHKAKHQNDLSQHLHMKTERSRQRNLRTLNFDSHP